MTFSEELDRFFSEENEVLVSDPLKFKQQLGIGQKAYGSLRKRENLRTFVEALSAGGMASAAAKSSAVAGTFFAKTGLVSGALSSIGLGATAATPIGWVLASGVLFGGAYAAASTFLERNNETGLIVVPKYINTPLDVIAVALMDLMLPVSLKVARSDGGICESERKEIVRYFVETWGYNPAYVSKAVALYEQKIEELEYEPLAAALSKYCEMNLDCDRKSIVSSLLLHLEDVAYANGLIESNQAVELALIRRLLNGEIDYRNDPSWYSRARKNVQRGLAASSVGWRSFLAESQKRMIRVTPNGIGPVGSAWARISSSVEKAVDFGVEARKQISKKARRLVGGASDNNK